MKDALRFLGAIAPELIGLIGDLHDRFKGDPKGVIRELARIREDGSKFLAAETAARAELQKLAGRK